MRVKKAKSLYTFLKPKLRRASMFWIGKKLARDAARVNVQEGFYKNGKPKMVKKFICAECSRNGKKETYYDYLTAMDHIIPVVDVKSEQFDGNWTKYITSLFCEPDNYQCLCISCHNEKTASENLQRDFYKKKKTKTPIKINKFPKSSGIVKAKSSKK